MKNLLLSLAALICLCSLAACGNEAEEIDETAVESPATSSSAVKYKLDTLETKITWMGHKVLDVGKAHRGTIKAKEGQMLIEDNKLVGGSIVIDMKSIDDLDLREANNMEGYHKLVNHLKSADFFDVEKYPTATFVVTSAEKIDEGGNNYRITGNMTMKDSTAGISFPADVSIGENETSAEADIIIDRSKFNVRYGSETYFPDLARDKVISNEIKLRIRLKADRMK